MGKEESGVGTSGLGEGEWLPEWQQNRVYSETQMPSLPPLPANLCKLDWLCPDRIAC
jgi:hypothetical protein